MKKLLMALVIFAVAFSASADLIISEYIETDSGLTPKGLELWNTGGSAIDFSVSTLDILVGVNGGALSSAFTLNTGTLAAGAIMVVGTQGLIDSVALVDPTVPTYLEAFTFNGDDAIQIQLGAVVQDTFGLPGNDPGTQWSGSGVSTLDQSIALNSGITTGDTDGWTDPSTRFTTTSTTPSTDIGGMGVAPSGAPIPEPATMSLLGLGALAMVLRRKIRK
jgi:hypothetical protein